MAVEKTQEARFIESDYVGVVSAINSNVDLSSLLGNIVSDYKFLLRTLENIRVQFVKRSTNVAAHTLAKTSRSWPSLYVWGYTPPPFL